MTPTSARRPYPLVRAGGLFVAVMGVGIGGGIAFSGPALVNYAVFYAALAIAIGSLFLAGYLSQGEPSRLQIAALAGAIVLEVALIIAMARLLPLGTAEHVRWLWVLGIVGVHFVPMALSFGPGFLCLGLACIANAAVGLRLQAVPFEIFGLIDGALKLAVGLWLFVPRRKTP